jgi:hypothetical protein
MTLPRRYSQEGLKNANIIILGPPGIGKTRMAIASLPPEARVAVMATEDGLLSVRDELAARPNCQVWDIQDYMEIYALLGHYSNMALKPHYLVLDSVNAMGDLVLEKCKRVFKGFDAWNEYNSHMEQLTKRIKAMETVSIFTSLYELTHITEPEEEVVYNPLIPGDKVQQKYLSWFDEVIFLDQYRKKKEDGEASRGGGEDDWEVLAVCGRTAKFRGKDRSGKLATYETPNLSNIIYKMLGELPGWKEPK